MLEERYPHAPRPFIDLSTGITPYPYPALDAKPEWLHRLPAPAEVQALEAAAARYYGALDVAVAPGMQPLMFALAALRLKQHGPSKICIPSPTYGEHARVWKSVGHTLVNSGGDVTVICNPNNPDGRIVAPDALPKTDWLIVDESFGDLTPHINLRPRGNTAVLRSCGKFFGLAGMRVSAAIAPPAWMEWIRMATGPWPVSTYACHALPPMFADAEWIAQTRMKLEQESAAWRTLLAQHFTLVGHTPLFTLVTTEKAAEWHTHLASRGILVRAFDHHPKWLRFGLPDASHMERVRAAFSA